MAHSGGGSKSPLTPVLPAVPIATKTPELFRTFFRSLYGSKWREGAVSCLGVTRRHVERLAWGERRIVSDHVGAMRAILDNRIRRREEELARELETYLAIIAAKRSALPWAHRYLDELSRRVPMRSRQRNVR